jgi:hypothetical protein
MKAFIKSWRALTRQAGPILLFDGEVGPLKPASILPVRPRGPDEHRQTDILTPG